MAFVEVYNIIGYSFWMYTPNVIDSYNIQFGYIYLLVGALIVEIFYFLAIFKTFVTMTPNKVADRD
jgi:hypothetical protein